ncbi:MAG: NACHT domain-containing protein, partial [Gammaproteobacteria bacterium]
GPWLIEFSTEFIKNNLIIEFNDQKYNIEEIRNKHAEILLQKNNFVVEQHFLLNESNLINNFLSNKQAKSLWINAPAGYGKSRFCNYLTVTDFGQNANNITLFIKLRTVNNIFDKKLDRDAITELLWRGIFKEVSSNTNQFPWWEITAIRNSLEIDDIIWIFDGYDELTETQQNNFLQFTQAIENKANHRYIVTSRPNVMFSLKETHKNLLIYHIQPFALTNILYYIDKYFHLNIDKANELKCFLQDRSNYQRLLRTPYHIELLCNIWGNVNSDELELKTITDLYLEIFYLLLKHDFIKKNPAYGFNIDKATLNNTLLGRYKISINAMEEIAFQLVAQKSLQKVIGQESISTAIRNDINAVGFLQINNGVIECIHKTFCEFLCARYIMKNLHKNEAVQLFISNNKFDPYYSNVWSFTAGLLEILNKKHLAFYWKILLDKPLDLTGRHQIPLLINCLEESQCSGENPFLSQLLELLKQCWQIAAQQVSPFSQLQNIILDSLSKTYYLLNVVLKNEFNAFFENTTNKLLLVKKFYAVNLPDEKVDFLFKQVNAFINNMLPIDHNAIIDMIHVFSEADISKQKLTELIINMEYWTKKLSENNQPQVLIACIKVLAKYALSSKKIFDMLFGLAKFLIDKLKANEPIYSYYIDAFSILCNLELLEVDEINQRAKLIINLYDVFTTKIYHSQSCLDNGGKIFDRRFYFKSIRKVKNYGEYEKAFVHKVLPNIQFIYEANFYIKDQLLRNQHKETIAPYLNASDWFSRLSALKVLYHCGYLLEDTKLLFKAMSMVYDKADKSLAPKARQMIKTIVKENNIYQLLDLINEDNINEIEIFFFWAFTCDKPYTENLLGKIETRNGISNYRLIWKLIDIRNTILSFKIQQHLNNIFQQYNTFMDSKKNVNNSSALMFTSLADLSIYAPLTQRKKIVDQTDEELKANPGQVYTASLADLLDAYSKQSRFDFLLDQIYYKLYSPRSALSGSNYIEIDGKKYNFSPERINALRNLERRIMLQHCV